jgi:hypothetical protein
MRSVFRKTLAGALVALLGFATIACAYVPQPTATPVPRPATPVSDPAAVGRAIAAAEAKLRFRASLPRDLPPDARITRVLAPNQSPPTLDIEYLIDDQTVLLRQRPAQSDPGFPAETSPIDVDGFVGRGMARVDDAGKFVTGELYWVRDGMDYALLGGLPMPELMRIAKSVARPSAA